MPGLWSAVVLAGRLLGSAIACGLNLYATVALLGLASRLDFIGPLPPGLAGLESWIVIGGATTLFAAEFVAAMIPWIDSAWEAVHTLIRPLAAAALAGIALEAAHPALQLGGAAVAAIAAFAAHTAKVGLRLVVTTRRWLRVAVSTAEDLAAAILAIAAFALPAAALVSVGLFFLILALAGPVLWRASGFALRALFARVHGFFGNRDWTDADHLPTAFRPLLDPPEIGPSPPRALKAALSGSPGAYRNGWLVFDRGTALFLYRRRGRLTRTTLYRPSHARLDRGFLADTITGRASDGDFQLRLLKDGPPADLALAALKLLLH